MSNYDPTEGPDAGHPFKPCRSDQCDLDGIIDERSCHAEVRPGYFCGYAEEQHAPYGCDGTDAGLGCVCGKCGL